MERRNPLNLRRIAILVAALALGLIFRSLIGGAMQVAFREFQAPLWWGESQMSDAADFWGRRAHSERELIQAGRDMARLYNARNYESQQLESLRAEVARLERILALPPAEGYRYEVARVVRRDYSHWWRRIVVRKGSSAGIREGAAVVFGGGVVGRVSETGAYTATIDLVSSPTFRMAAHFEGDPQPVTYQGVLNVPFREPVGEVFNVRPDITVPAGVPRRLVSSKLGGVFPDGLTIGFVGNLELDPDGLFKRGQVELPSALHSLSEVAVLVPLVPDEPEAE